MSMNRSGEITLPLFVVLWNRIQDKKTPALHIRILKWLEARWQCGDRRLLLMAFRSAGKSTLVGLFAAWLLYQKPNLRILVLAADQALARKMVRNVKQIIEKHPLTKGLKPERADQWASDSFTIQRNLALRDPSMLARGIDGNITGSRADIIVCDDVEVPRTSDTAGKREDLRAKLDEASYVLTPQGTQIYVGTPHHYYSIYADVPRQELGENRIYLEGYQRLVLPILDEAGASQWPERFSLKSIEQLRRDTGPIKFRSQMMLEPANIAESRLDTHLLHFYEEDLKIDFSATRKRLFVAGDEIVALSGYWDPAFGQGENKSQKRDGSVFALLLLGQSGKRYLHDLRYLKIVAGQSDEASQQAGQIVRLCENYGLRRIAVEINGIGRFLPGILRQALKVSGLRCAVEEVVSKTAKDIRILEAFDALLAARALHVRRCVTKTPFIREMQEWAPGGESKTHDDGLDAVAGALVRLPQHTVRSTRKEQALRLRETDFSVF